MTERDPRQTPAKGDVLGKRGTTRTVVYVHSGIVRPGTFVTSIDSRLRREVVWSGVRWREWAKSATVLTPAQES